MRTVLTAVLIAAMVSVSALAGVEIGARQFNAGNPAASTVLDAKLKVSALTLNGFAVNGKLFLLGTTDVFNGYDDGNIAAVAFAGIGGSIDVPDLSGIDSLGLTGAEFVGTAGFSLNLKFINSKLYSDAIFKFVNGNLVLTPSIGISFDTAAILDLMNSALKS